MSFEEVPGRVHKSRQSWGMSIGKHGIVLWLPRGHWLEKSPSVVTQIGKSDDLGKLRLLPAREGRKVMLANKHNVQKSYFIKYSTLTGAPGNMSMASLDVLEEKEGEVVMLRLPWARVAQPASLAPPVRREGYSMMDRGRG